MQKARLWVMAGLSGATLCLFAATSYAQNTDPAAATSAQTGAQTTAQPAAPTGDNTAQPAADPGTSNGTITTTGSQTTTETTSFSFPGGVWGIAAVAVVVLLVLFSLFRGRDTTVVKDTYVTADSPPVTRTSGMGTSNDRIVTSRAASGPETTTTTTRSSDPNAQR